MIPKLVLVDGLHQILIVTLTDDLPIGVILSPIFQPLGPGAILRGPETQGDGVGVFGTRESRELGKGGDLLLLDGLLLAA